MKLQRLIAILTLLLQRERVSAPWLAEKFGVSVRTIYRDVEALEGAGIPIVSHTGAHGGLSIIDAYKIDKKLFTHQDIATLLQGLNSVSGPLSSAQLNQTLVKIQSLIPEAHTHAIELTSRQLYIDLTPWSGNVKVSNALAHIQRGLAENKMLRFSYSAREQSAQARLVEPHQLVLKENQWYLKAWCTQRQGFRTFKLRRMEAIALCDETFTPRDFQSGMEDFKDWQNDRVIYVDMVIEQSLRELALDYCREEYMTDRPDGKIDIHMPFVESETGYGVLLSMGPRCIITGPEHIRLGLAQRLDEMCRLYRA